MRPEPRALLRRLRESRSELLEINWALVDQALVSACNFATTIVLVRALGYHEFGVFSLAWAGLMTALSLHHPLVTAPMLALAPKADVANAAAHYHYAVRTNLVVAPALALLLALSAAATGWLGNKPVATSLAVPLGLGILAAATQDLVRRYQFARAAPRAALASDALAYGGKLALLSALALGWSLTAPSALLCVAAASAAGCLPGLSLLRIRDTGGMSSHDRQRHHRYSRWMTAMSVLNLLYEHLYLVVVALFAGAGAAGVLRAVQAVIGVLHVLFAGVQNIGVPRASRLIARRTTSAFRRYILHLCLLIVLLTSGFLLVININPAGLLTLLYGQEGTDGTIFLRMFSLLYLLLALTIPFAIALRALEHTREIFIIQAISTGLTLAILFAVLPFTGTIGAVWALAAGGMASLLAHLYYVRTVIFPAHAQGAG